MSRELEVVNLRDFHSASVLVKRLGVGQVFCIDILLEDVVFELTKETNSSDWKELFSNKVEDYEVEITRNGTRVRFIETMNDGPITYQGDDIKDIHKLAEYQDNIENIFGSRLKIYMFLQPIGIQA